MSKNDVINVSFIKPLYKLNLLMSQLVCMKVHSFGDLTELNTANSL